ncbi:MAG: hypothetical protein LUD29_06750 [Clostridia bacterium]|nr:hypothetical protein [Clostridia bacterium]
MEKLLSSTAAYRILSSDKKSGRLSHAYMLHFPDAQNLRAALRMLAAEMYGGDGHVKRQIKEETWPDVRMYPAPGKKLSVDDASEIVDDSAIRPSCGDTKIYVISDFDLATALFQNKLLKSLEEPPEGIMFLLGATSTASVLTTVRSRVKTLEIPPFSVEEIYEALERENHDDKNMDAAKASGGILSAAQNMVKGDRYNELVSAAREIFTATKRNAGEIAAKYKDFKFKRELMGEIELLAHSAMTKSDDPIVVGPLLNLCERIDRIIADIRFNVYFSQVIFNLIMVKEGDKEKWEGFRDTEMKYDRN